MRLLHVLDLFSGIGGFTLGLERTGGFCTVAFCEADRWCRRHLARHWPDVPCYDDIRVLNRHCLLPSATRTDVLTGGFPCQDISIAGCGAGLAGARSSLWFEYRRLVEEIQPHWAIIENVPALRSRGLEDILGSLAALGYDAEWHCVPAASLGAPHRRDRIWIVAYPAECRRRAWRPQRPADGGERQLESIRAFSDVAFASEPRLSLSQQGSLLGPWRREERRTTAERGWWTTEPDVGRVAHGVPDRVHRLKALGNAIIPQMATLIGNAILTACEEVTI
jgi:DNA (cytosine-5)-methyltransferase 1